MGDTRILANGAIYDMEKKRIVGNPGGGTTAITQSNATELINKRWRDRQAAFERGMERAFKETGQLPDGDHGNAATWEVIGNKTATLLLDEQDGGKYARLLDAARKILQDDKRQDDSMTFTARINASDLVALVGALRAARADVIDVQPGTHEAGTDAQTQTDPNTPTTTGDDV